MGRHEDYMLAFEERNPLEMIAFITGIFVLVLILACSMGLVDLYIDSSRELARSKRKEPR